MRHKGTTPSSAGPSPAGFRSPADILAAPSAGRRHAAIVAAITDLRESQLMMYPACNRSPICAVSTHGRWRASCRTRCIPRPFLVLSGTRLPARSRRWVAGVRSGRCGPQRRGQARLQTRCRMPSTSGSRQQSMRSPPSPSLVVLSREGHVLEYSIERS